ncbi:hypothetical protein LINPERPRIM_LOCUS6689 [Linum perenne]
MLVDTNQQSFALRTRIGMSVLLSHSCWGFRLLRIWVGIWGYRFSTIELLRGLIKIFWIVSIPNWQDGKLSHYPWRDGLLWLILSSRLYPHMRCKRLSFPR